MLQDELDKLVRAAGDRGHFVSQAKRIAQIERSLAELLRRTSLQLGLGPLQQTTSAPTTHAEERAAEQKARQNARS
jgi:hypothetical protein